MSPEIFLDGELTEDLTALRHQRDTAPHDLLGRQPFGEQPADEQPAEQGHREGLHGPVHEQRHADTAPVSAYLAERAEIDLEQHRDDHEPDQHGDRQIHARDLEGAQQLERCG